MKLLGLSLGQLATAALFIDDRIVACVSEERFSRVKHDEAYPLNAIEYVLKEGHVDGQELDVILIAGSKLNVSTHLLRTHSSWHVPDHIRLMREFWYPKLYENRDCRLHELFKDKIDVSQYPGAEAWGSFLKASSQDYYSGESQGEYTKFVHKIICDHLCISDKRIKHLDHHICHAAYAYWAGPLRGEDVLVMSVDAFGDDLSGTLSLPVNQGGLKRVHAVSANDFTLGRLYRYMTLLLGMEPNSHEYKVMGLAPYAKEPIYSGPLNVFKRHMYVDGIDFKFYERPKDHYFWFKDRLEGFRFDGIAGGLQKYTEDIMTEYTLNAMNRFGSRRLALSGGIAMNIKVNMMLKDLADMNDMFVPPSGGDESLAMGVCYAYMDEVLGRRDMKPLDHAYLGPALKQADVDGALLAARRNGYFVYEAHDDFLADLLSDGWVIGRCSGRMEFGARSLGNRSIIADPRNRSIVEIINHKIKKRDFWMPFAPTIMSEHASKYLINPKAIPSPFMTVGFESTEAGQEMLAAALHPADKTLRPQILSRDANPEYHSLIQAFHEKTGAGGVLNTSFNLHGEPIVSTATDAYRVFNITDIDALLLDGKLITKKEPRSSHLKLQ
ncbi:MAG: carbamoyl transferase [Deltaproteobacteria bacterium]|nr:carbamoyl transferase [Deltaproteobacteria bacterium]